MSALEKTMFLSVLAAIGWWCPGMIAAVFTLDWLAMAFAVLAVAALIMGAVALATEVARS